MKPIRVTIDQILVPFFEANIASTTGIKQNRISQVELHLRHCLEDEGPRVLTTGDLRIVSAEQDFQPDGAFARTMHADDLVFVLAIFTMPPWLLHDPTLLRVQLALTERLTATVLHNGLVDYQEVNCPLLDIDAAITQTMWALNSARREKAKIKRMQRAGAGT